MLRAVLMFPYITTAKLPLGSSKPMLAFWLVIHKTDHTYSSIVLPDEANYQGTIKDLGS